MNVKIYLTHYIRKNALKTKILKHIKNHFIKVKY